MKIYLAIAYFKATREYQHEIVGADTDLEALISSMQNEHKERLQEFSIAIYECETPWIRWREAKMVHYIKRWNETYPFSDLEKYLDDVEKGFALCGL